MPVISANPAVKTEFTLPKWAALTDRPCFFVKYMTAAEVEEWADLYSRAVAVADNAECWKLLWAAMQIGIIGWNLKDADAKPVPFTEDDVYDSLLDTEKFDVAGTYPTVVRLTPRQKKSSDLPIGFDGAKSVETAKDDAQMPSQQ